MLYKGLECLVLENEQIRVCILPQIGSHICSFYDKTEGRELLLQAPGVDYVHPENAANFDFGECAGIDDMFPAAAPTVYRGEPFDGLALPDHGEVWSSAFSVLSHSSSEAVMVMEGALMPYRLKKRFVLDKTCLRVEYTLTNLSDLAYRYIWAAHPMFAGCESYKVLLPDTVDRVTIGWGEGTAYTPGKEYSWPVITWDDGSRMDVSAAPQKDAGYCYKPVTVAPMTKGWCALVDTEAKYGLEICFDAEQTPFLGIWIDGNGLSSKPQYDIAIEPSTTRSVYVEEQGREDKGYLEAHQKKTWWISYKAGKYESYSQSACRVEFSL